MMTYDPLRVLIVGCGNIAGIFDMKRSDNCLPYTHAGAYKRDQRFSLVACVEPNLQRRTEFMAAWEIALGFESINNLIDEDFSFDVISICSPTGSHFDDLSAALQLRPRLIFCEKPIAPSIQESEELIEACKKLDIFLAINYTRRWDPDIVELKKNIVQEKWGSLRAVNGIYNKGLLNNGSHMIDILHFLIGDLTLIDVGRSKNDFFLNDPTIDIWLEDACHIPVHITSGDAQDYSIFELQFIFSLGVLSMENGGLSWRERPIVESEDFVGYQVLSQGVNRLGNYSHAMTSAIDNIYGAIYRNESLVSNGESALITQKICENILQKSCAQKELKNKQLTENEN